MNESGQFIANLLDSTAKAIAATTVHCQTESSEAALPDGVRSQLTADTEIRLGYLAESLAAGCPELFVDHVHWLRRAYDARGVPAELLVHNLRCLREQLIESLPPGTHELALAHLDAGLEATRTALPAAPEPLDGGGPYAELTRRFLLAQLEARRADAIGLLEEAAQSGTSIADLEVHVVSRAQHEMGRMWLRGEVRVAEEHLGCLLYTSPSPRD